MSNLTYKESINEGCLKRIDSILKKKEVDLSKRVFKENLLSAEQIKVLDDYKNFCVGGGSGRIKSLSTTVTALCNMKTLGEFIKKPYKTGEEYPAVVKWMKPQIKSEKIKFDDLPSEDDIKKLINANNGKDVENIRNRALIMTLMDSGGRISEILNVKLKEIEKTEFGLVLCVDGKTGERKIQLTRSVSFLNEWLDVHPHKHDENTPLFICLKKMYGCPLGRGGVRRILVMSKKRAGIKKKVNPHSWRHLACTRMSLQGFNEMELGLHFGWADGSKMASRYNHTRYKDLSQKILIQAGLFKETKEQIDKLKDVVCQCGTSNRFGTDYCKTCGTLISPRKIKQETTKVEDMQKQMQEMKDMIEMMQRGWIKPSPDDIKK